MIDLEKVLEGYVACAFWSSNVPISRDETISLDEINAVLSTEAAWNMLEEVAGFVELETPKLEFAKALVPTYTDEQIGHDFWLTRNHHGTGFWDRGLGATGDSLTAAAHVYGESNLFVIEQDHETQETIVGVD